MKRGWFLAAAIGAAAVAVTSASPPARAEGTSEPLRWRVDNVYPKVWPDVVFGTTLTLEFEGCRGAHDDLEQVQVVNGDYPFIGVSRGAANASITYTPPLGSSGLILWCYNRDAADAAKEAGLPREQWPPAVPINKLYVTFDTYLPGSPPSSEFRSFVPGRLLDSRPGGSTVDNDQVGIGIRPAGSVTQVLVAGRHGVPLNAKAVALNVTVTGAEGDGFVTVFPCSGAPPNASNLNFVRGSTIPNAVISKVGAGGVICLYTDAATHLIVDVNGYFPATSTFTPTEPGRIMDTRAGGQTVDHLFEGIGMRTAGSITELEVGGRYDVPRDAKSVALNVTVAGAATGGFVTVFPCGTDVPNASNLNHIAGSTIPNLVLAKLGTGGKVCFYTAGTTHLIVDVNGYLPAASPFVPLSPGRLMDSRSGGQTVDHRDEGVGMVGTGATYELQVGGRHNIPASATAVMLNVTVTGASGNGFITVYPCGTLLPNASNLNYTAGATVPNAVVAKLPSSGKICLFAETATHLIVDANGYLPATSS